MNSTSSPTAPLWLRFLQHPLTRLILLGGVLFSMMAMSDGIMKKFAASPPKAIAAAAGMALLAMAIYMSYARFIERRPADELSLPSMAKELGTGLLIGAALYTVCFLILMGFGVYTFDGLNPWTFVIPAVAMALHSGIFEELVFRGVLFRSVEDMFGSWVALAVSAIVFGMLHLINPAATLEGAVFISIEAGILLAAAYMLTRRLWLSIGFHMAWNYTQSAIFSGIVSGGVAEPGLIKSNIRGPNVLTGGAFGLESSVVAFVLCTAAGIVLLVMAVRGGKIVPPKWLRGQQKS